MQEVTDNVTVMVRVRPLSDKELQEDDSRVCLRIHEKFMNSVVLETKPDPKCFTFDYVASEYTTQLDVFNTIGRPIANACLEGYNCCLFAYGQTGAGKTYTIQGQNIENLNLSNYKENQSRGLLPRVIEYLFSIMNGDDMQDESQASLSPLYTVRCSLLEIYNEHIIDLLNTGSGNLQIREDSKKGVYVEGLTEESTNSCKAALDLLIRGNRNRHIGSTDMNIESSRSHSVFSMIIESKTEVNNLVNVKTSRFNLVDLAGSERQKLTVAQGERLKEGCNINRSLLILGNVINALVDVSEGKTRHIHYRDSKLTFLLRDSLGGNSKTSIIANVSPAAASFGETLSTLKFAQRAKLIKNNASINEDATGTIESLKNEILRQRQEIAVYKQKIKFQEILVKNNISPEKKFQESQKLVELSQLLRQSLETLSESEAHLQSELGKKDEILSQLKSGYVVFDKNVLQLKMVIKLLNSKIERLNLALDQKLSKEVLADLAEFSKEVQIKESGLVREIVDNLPSMMRLVSENITLKEQLNCSEESDASARGKIVSQLAQNLSFLQMLCHKIDDGALENQASRNNQSLETREEPRSAEVDEMIREKIERIRSEYNEKIEELNVEIFDSERLVQDLQKSLEKEKLSSELLRNEITVVQTQKARSEELYETRIKELLVDFETIQASNLTASKVEEVNQELTMRILETKERLNNSLAKNEELAMLVREKDEQLLIIQQRMTSVEQQLKAVSEKKLRDSLAYEQLIYEMKMQLTELESDRREDQKIIENLKFKTSITAEEKNQVENLLEATKNTLNDITLRYSREKTDLQAQLAEFANKLIKSEENFVISQSLFEELQKKLAMKSEEEEELKLKVSTSENELESFKNEMKRIFAELQVDFEQKMQLQEAEALKKLGEQENQLNQRLELEENLFRQEITSLQEKIRHVEQTNNELVSEKQSLFEEINYLKGNIQQQSQENDEAVKAEKSRLEALEEELYQVRVELMLELEERSKFEKVRTEYEELLENNTLEKERYSTEINQLNEFISELKEKLDEAAQIQEHERRNLDKVMLEYEEAQQRESITKEQYTAKVSQLNKIVAELKERLEEATQQLEHEKKSSEEMKLAYEEAQQNESIKQQQYAAKISQLNQVVEELNIKLNEAEQHINEIEEEKRKLVEQYNYKEVALHSFMAEEEETKLAQLKESYDQVIEYLGEKNNKEIAELKQVHAREMEQIDLKHTEELHEIYEQRRVILEELAKKRDSKIEELANSDVQKLERLQAELSYYKERCSELEEASGLSEQYQVLLRANQDLSSRLNEAYQEGKAQQQQFAERISQLQKDIHTKELQIAELNALLIQKKKDSAQKELKEIQEQYLQMRKEHKNLIANFGAKEAKIQSLTAELNEAMEEKERLSSELTTIKQMESKLRKENQEYSEKIARLNSEHYLLLKELDNLNKQNDTLAGHTNNDQKIRHLNKLKEENSKLKDEKLRLVDELTKTQENALRIQRKLDELVGGKPRTTRDSEETEGYGMEHKMYSESFERIVQLLRDGMTLEEQKRYNLNSRDTEAVIAALQQEKNKYIHAKENEIQSILLQNTILEKELLLYKQKIQLKKQHQAQSGLSSQALNPLSTNTLLIPNSQIPMLRSRENAMRIEDQTISDENDERRAKGSFFDRRY